MGREKQHARSGRDAAQLPRQGDAVAIGQVEVGDDHIGSKSNGKLTGMMRIAALGDDTQVSSLWQVSQSGAHADPEDRRRVHQQ